MGPLRASRDRIAPRVPGHGHPPGGARGSVGAEAELATPGAEPSGAWATPEGYESTRQTGANTRKNIIFSPISPDFLGRTVGFVVNKNLATYVTLSGYSSNIADFYRFFGLSWEHTLPCCYSTCILIFFVDSSSRGIATSDV